MLLTQRNINLIQTLHAVDCKLHVDRLIYFEKVRRTAVYVVYYYTCHSKTYYTQ